MSEEVEFLIKYLNCRGYRYVNIPDAKSLRIIYDLFKYDRLSDHIDPIVCLYYGVYYEIKNDSTRAFEWFQKSTEMGDTYGIVALADCYFYGQVVGQDYNNMISLYEKAAALGNPHAMCRLGECYETGIGFTMNKETAVTLYKKATDLGSRLGLTWLGECYKNGIGVQQDYKIAVNLYNESAKLGCRRSMFYLGLCYLEGNGIDKDMKSAIFWLNKSKELCSDRASMKLQELFPNGEMLDIYISIMRENEENSIIIQENDKLIHHLKSYPGSDFKRAMANFNLLSNPTETNE